MCGWPIPLLGWRRLPFDRFCSLVWRVRPAMPDSNLTIVPMHGKGTQVMRRLTQVSHLQKTWKSIAERLPLKSVWQYVCERITTRVVSSNWPTSQKPLLYLCPESP